MIETFNPESKIYLATPTGLSLANWILIVLHLRVIRFIPVTDLNNFQADMHGCVAVV